MTETNKCSKNGLCDELLDAVDSTDGGKGIKVLRGITQEMMFSQQFSIADAPVIAIFYKTCAKSKGRLFKFCPFCGEKFTWSK